MPPQQYNVASLVFSWFALANLWLTFSLIIDLTVNQGIKLFGTVTVVSFAVKAVWRPYSRPLQTNWVNQAFKWIYLAFLAMQVRRPAYSAERSSSD